MTEHFTIKGDWYLPSNIEQRFHGTLTYHPKEGTSLELYGSFDEDNFLPEFKDQEIILGLSSDSKQITLCNCNMIKSGGATLVRGEESGKPSTTYSIRYLLIGLHEYKLANLKFDHISCEIFNLGEWVGVSGFIHRPHDGKKFNRHEVSIEYRLPEGITFPIDKHASGGFKFITSVPGLSRYQKEATISQRVEFEVNTTKGKNIEELLAYIIGFQNFLTIALYRSTYPVSIKLTGSNHTKDWGDGKQERKQVKLYFSSRNLYRNEKPKFDIEMLFCYQQIKNEFPTLIQNWYAKYELLEPAFNLVFEQFYNGNRFTVNTFLNLAQAAETFHARSHNHTKIPKAEFAAMREEILKAVSPKFHNWLNEQFSYGNNLSLHTRLTEIVDKYSNAILDKIIADKEKFVLNVKHSRNYYTHYSNEGKNKALNGSALFYLSERLKILLVCSFLIEIGFNKDSLSASLDNVKWVYFYHLANWGKIK